jgi:hypothetical protein
MTILIFCEGTAHLKPDAGRGGAGLAPLRPRSPYTAATIQCAARPAPLPCHSSARPGAMRAMGRCVPIASTRGPAAGCHLLENPGADGIRL